MNCPKCNYQNDDTNVFCINCGETFLSSINSQQTLMSPTTLPETLLPTQSFNSLGNQTPDYQSNPTVFAPHPTINQSNANYNQSNANFNPSSAGFNPSIPFIPAAAAPKSRLGLWISLGVLLLFLLGGGIIAAIFLINKPVSSTETLPDHLGMFFQNSDKTSVEELKKQDFTNGLEGKDKLLKDDTIPTLESKPNLILYSDGKDIPLSDLKLIELDSIKTDGTMKLIDYKATPVEGKPEMKRLWFSENLAKGKYVFALIDGAFDDGKHKFWAFQVKTTDKTDNSGLVKETNVLVKNKSNKSDSKNSNDDTDTEKETVTPTPKPVIPPPVGARSAYSVTNNVVVRAAPGLGAQKVGGLRRGQRVYILGYSSNYDYWNGLEGNWANIQTESGQRGWVFSPLLR